MRKILVAAFVVAVAVLSSSPAFAQVCGTGTTTVIVTATTQLCFEPSPDHAAKLPDGTDKVTSYAWGYYLPGAQLPVQEYSLGKPAPGTDGAIRLVPAQLIAVPLDTTYEARVVAIGPQGRSAVSNPSNPFARPAPLRAPAAPKVINPPA